MKGEAEANASADKERRELVDVKNRAEQMVFQTKQALEEHGEKVGEEVKAKIEAAVAEVEAALSGEDKSAIEESMKKLESESMELGKAAYEAARLKQSPTVKPPRPPMVTTMSSTLSTRSRTGSKPHPFTNQTRTPPIWGRFLWCLALLATKADNAMFRASPKQIEPIRSENYPEWYQQVVKATWPSPRRSRVHGHQAVGVRHLGEHPA